MNLRIAALDFIACSLAIDKHPAAVERLRRNVGSAQPDWGVVVSMSNRHLVTPALWAGLRDKGLVDILPEDLGKYLETLYFLNRERNLHVKAQVVEAVRALNGQGIEPVLLKGAAHLFTDTFGDPGARMMADVDMLVPMEGFENSLAVFHALGYRADDDSMKEFAHHHHHAPLLRPGDYAAVELHRDLISRAAAHMMTTETTWAHARPLEVEHVRMKVLSPTYRVLHNIVHSEIVDRHHQKGLICLRQIHDLAALCARHRGEIDWATIQDRMDRHGKAKVLESYLYLGHRLLGIPQPPEVSRSFVALAHSLRCRLKIRFEQFDRLDYGLQRFSAWRIRRVYGCGSGFWSLSLARMRYARYLLKKYARQRA